MKRLIYIAVGIIIYMCMGTIYSWSVFRKPLESALGIGATESGYPYMVFLAMYAFSMPFAGRLIDKIGPKKVAIAGGVVTAIGWITAGFSDNILMITLTYGFIGGMGVGITYGVPIAVAGKWFPESRGAAVGLTLIGFGISPFVTAPIVSYLISTYSVFKAFEIVGIVFLILIPLLSLFLRFPKQNEIDFQSVVTENKSVQDLSVGLRRNREFWGLWIGYVIGTFTGLTAVGIASSAAQEIIGLTSGGAAILVSGLAVFNGIGRPIFGYTTDRLGVRKTGIIIFSLSAAASVILLIFAGNTLFFIAGFSVLWMTLGGWLSLAPAATVKLFGERDYSKNYGVVFTAYGVGAVLGVSISGKIKDLFGSYHYIFVITLFLAIAGIVVFIKNIKAAKS